MASRAPRNETSPPSLRRSRDFILKTTKTLPANGGDSLAQSHIDEMLSIMDTVPLPLKRFHVDEATLELVRKNASAAASGSGSTSATPKRPRSDSDLSQTESAKRLRSSLRSSSKSHAPPNQPDFSEESVSVKQEPEKPKPQAAAQAKAKSTSSSEPENDANALLTFARDLKHRGEAERKQSHESVKRAPSTVSKQYDRFVENYLRASLAYLRACALYESKRLIDQARDMYVSTAQLAIYAAAGIVDESPLYRRALASLCLKSASIAYARRYQMGRKKSVALNAQLEEAIRSKSTDVTVALDLVKKLRTLSEECDSDARSSLQRWTESLKIAPEGLNDFEIEVPLSPEIIAFADYAKAEQQSARYLGEAD